MNAPDKMEEAELSCEQPRGFLERLHGDWLEVVSAILLALATVASAWCAYQSARWRSLEAENFNAATAARVHASELYDLADQERDMDTDMFMNYTEAWYRGDEAYMKYMEEILFRDEMKIAMQAWKATDPINNPNAPETPFDMEEYVLENQQQADSFEVEAQKITQEAKEAIHYSDNYILLTVLFASVLFFAGICTKFKKEGVRIMVLMTGACIFAASLAILFFLPFH